jgi:cytochrome P450
LKVGSHQITVPRNSRVVLAMYALHSRPCYWGKDDRDEVAAADLRRWRPQRWIETTDGGGPVFDRERLVTLPKGAFIPWSDGQRACPGKKFAQVEHVAIMATVFKKYRIAALPEGNEDEATAQARARQAVDDSALRLLMQMLHPERVVLQVRKR